MKMIKVPWDSWFDELPWLSAIVWVGSITTRLAIVWFGCSRGRSRGYAAGASFAATKPRSIARNLHGLVTFVNAKSPNRPRDNPRHLEKNHGDNADC